MSSQIFFPLIQLSCCSFPLQNGGTPLMHASLMGHEEVVKVLLQERATVDMQAKVLLDWTFHQLFSFFYFYFYFFLC